MFKAALFDLDGTLIDSEILWVKAARDYIRANGYPCSDEEALRIVYGRSWYNIVRDSVVLAPRLASLTPMQMADQVRGYYTQLAENADISISGSVSLFKRLSQSMTTAIVSGSPRLDIETAVKKLNIENDISFIIGAEEYGEGKPNPQCYLMGAERAGAKPSECVVFEDATVGVQAAKNAGMYCVALRIPGRPVQDLSAADEILTDLNDWQIPTL